MVIECNECHTRFKLADEKVKPGGTKVRCSKCKQIFTVMPPPTTEAEIDFGEFNMERVAEPEKTPAAAAPPAEVPAEKGLDDQTAGTSTTISFDQESEDEFTFGDEEQATASDEFDFGEEPGEQPAAAAFDQESEDEFTFGGEEQETAEDEFTFGEEPEAGNEAGIADFAFDEKDEAGLSDDDFGSEDDAFSFEEADAKGSVEFAFDEEETGAETASEFSWDEEESAEEGDAFDFGASKEPIAEGDDFDFSGISFGEDDSAPAVPMHEESRQLQAEAEPVLVGTESLAPRREPPAPKAAAAAPPEFHPSAPPVPRRRKSPLKGLMFFICILLLAMIAGAVYFYWRGDIPELTNLVDRLTGQTTPAEVSGQIRLEGLSSFYIANREAGQMLVIQGNAVNDYPEARSSITVKGVLFNKAGKSLLQQTVYCGNPLKQEALGKLPFAKIEESMNNPFGESLSNLNVAPGKSLPFTIIFRNLPADIAEFTVEPAESKPGTKQ